MSTYNQIQSIYDTLAAIKTSLDEPVHRYAAVAMRQQLKGTIEAMAEMRSDLDKLRPKAFHEGWEKLSKEYAELDEKKKPKTQRLGPTQQSYIIDPAREVAFEAAFTALKAEHQTAIDAYDAANIKLTDLLKSEMDATPQLTVRLKLSWFNKTVSQDHIETLYHLIDDDLAPVAAPAKKSAPKE